MFYWNPLFGGEGRRFGGASTIVDSWGLFFLSAGTLASTPGAGKKTHVPFRRSKLTLLLKDVFDFSCTRICSTVVIAVSAVALQQCVAARTPPCRVLRCTPPCNVLGCGDP